MDVFFYIAAAVAIISTVLVITRKHPVHALLYLIVSFLAVAIIFYQLGAPFVAALEIVLYAGAIVVLFIFVVMMLNLGKETSLQEKTWLNLSTWLLPGILASILLIELVYLINTQPNSTITIAEVDPKAVALSLFGPYLIGVELAAMLLMAGVIGAAHIGQRKKKYWHRFLQEDEQ
ncbi:NADH-quinone oxidoreductase subunit J [Solitalea sp. MAHUQ-68]|uniref:NADH-quinone oxidoreductase subunit J n=1 Tax=Solitalea agri TaxID=2953739 RepID=A0A9X2F1V5_9SPHI|nr:NADH-quinone oxidoreductase subunit J [Solitalea agri]MCO4292650.1 NADH-quinone oxidoreductase subunit J [Solitalea agri]